MVAEAMAEFAKRVPRRREPSLWRNPQMPRDSIESKELCPYSDIYLFGPLEISLRFWRLQGRQDPHVGRIHGSRGFRMGARLATVEITVLVPND